MNFTEQQLKNFVAYERVRQGGRYNMFDPGAMRSTGLDRDEYLFVMEHYVELEIALRGKEEKK